MNSRYHMLLAWGLMGSIVLAFAAGLWLPANDALKRNQDRIGNAQSRIEKVRKLVATQQDLKERITALSQATSVDDRRRFFNARSTALGVAEMQRKVLSIIKNNHGNQVSSQPLAGSTVGDFHKLDVTVSLSADIPTLQGILYDFESGEPQIFVEQLLVSARTVTRQTHAGRRTLTSGSVTAGGAGPLSARMLLSGYMPAGEASDAQTAR